MSNHEPASKPLICVVDDDEIIRMVCQKALMESGLEVTEAESGEELLEKIHDHKPDLILLDVMMPGINGFDTCVELRKLPIAKQLPVILMTGLDDTDSINKAFEAGATDYLPKPFKEAVLCNRVKYVLRNYQNLLQLWESEARLAQAEKVAKVGSWEWDLDSGRIECSNQFKHLLDFDDQAEITVDSIKKRVPDEDIQEFSNFLAQAINNTSLESYYHRVMIRDEIKVVHHQIEVKSLRSEKKKVLFGTIQDVTKLKQAEQKIKHLAYYDVLTGLPNRTLFKDRLFQAISQANRASSSLAVMFLDVDRFKRINDTLGHSVGDALLKEVAERISNVVRSSDSVARDSDSQHQEATTARLGGDEFTILLTGIDYVQQTVRIAKRILEAIDVPININNQEIRVTASIGIALYPDDGVDVDTLLKQADSAMYFAKDQGRNAFKFYSKSINAKAFERLVLENELRTAIENNQLLLHYQPQVNIRTGKIVGAEALVRWKHPKLGMVSPGEFMQIAEEMGVVHTIDKWVMKEAACQNKTWRSEGLPSISVAVNVSNQFFWHPDFVNTVIETLNSTQLPPDGLDIELTEGIIIQDPDLAPIKIEILKEMGLKLSMDDFGTGYSSLSQMQHFPCDKLKIDRSFILNLESGDREIAIVKAIFVMAQAQDMSIVAEGVETVEQLSFLIEQNCDQVQGYYFSRPLPAEDFYKLLKSDKAYELPQVEVLAT